MAPHFGLAAGFLTGEYREGQPPPRTARAEGVLERYANPRGLRALAALERVAQGRGQTPSQVALAWLAAQPTVAAPIASATSPEQLRELLGAFCALSSVLHTLTPAPFLATPVTGSRRGVRTWSASC